MFSNIQKTLGRCVPVLPGDVASFLHKRKDIPFFKVIIPCSMEAFKDGLGETLWAKPISPEEKRLLDPIVKDVVIKAALFNKSSYICGLPLGGIVDIEIRRSGPCVLVPELLARKIGVTTASLLEYASFNKQIELSLSSSPFKR